MRRRKGLFILLLLRIDEPAFHRSVTMSFLTPFRERLWHMFSPGEPSPPSPETPEPQTEQLHKVRKESVAQQPARRKSLSPIVKRVKRVEEDPIFSYDEDNPDDSDESLSGSEADADDESQSVSEEDEDEDGKPKPKRLKRSKDFTADSDHESEEEVEEQAADITAEEKDEYGIGVTIEPVAHATLGDLGYEGWTQDELNLYNRLNDRGVVPLLHTSWRDDFPTIPEVLFTTDPDEAYIKNELGTEFRGKKPTLCDIACFKSGSFKPLTSSYRLESFIKSPRNGRARKRHGLCCRQNSCASHRKDHQSIHHLVTQRCWARRESYHSSHLRHGCSTKRANPEDSHAHDHRASSACRAVASNLDGGTKQPCILR